MNIRLIMRTITTALTSLSNGKIFRLQCLLLIQFLLLSLNTEAAVRVIDGICYTLDVKTGQAEVTRDQSLLYQGDIVIPDSVVYEGRTFHALLQGQARNKVATIAFVFANEDNRFNIPLPWTQQ